ncbi:MAG: DEAD/DEAH box helicase [Candidatus Aenigmatarchaeota archaeon]|nr:MAG: DEAD/DEAH box helicase [Candidatus Aenigmarchaeota archaeon]
MSPANIVNKVLEVSGFPEINPVQKAALDAGLLDGENMVLAAATASGKTLAAEMAMLKAVNQKKKTLYIVPLKALASEKYAEFKEKYKPMGIKVAMSVGDKDSSDPWLAGFDVIIVTSEKLDSLIRHGAEWLVSVGLVVADEIHLIDSPDRGPTLEVILTRLRQLIKPQILALSATISNYNELADWLQAKPVKSDYRPVKLYSGVFQGNEISWDPKKPKLVLPANLPPVFEIAKDTMKRGKQALIFVYTRKNSETLAEKLADIIRPTLTPGERKELVKLSHDVSHVLEHPTRQCQKLGYVLQRGAVFHHAGLVAKQRHLIEDAFRKGLIKVICATPTLAAGVNLPAYRVVVRDFKRFTTFRGGMDYIPVLEIQQMCGRAGRPTYDTEGEAILIAKDNNEAKKLWKEYIKGEPEKIVSKLGVEPVLRTHVLALIAAADGTTKDGLMEFFSKTFYAHQYRDTAALEREIDNVLEKLHGFRFIEREGSESGESFGEFVSASSLAGKADEVIKPTRIGRRVAELYIDPLSANHLLNSIETIEKEKKLTGLSILHALSGCVEMPGVNIRKKDMENEEGDTLMDFVLQFNQHFLGKIPNEWELEYDDFLREAKLVRLLNDWAEEKGEDILMEEFGVTPGELRARLEIADWLFYSVQELGILLNKHDMMNTIRKTRLRVKHGIKEELLPLVKLKNVGRARARKLFNNGYRSIEKLRRAPVTSITNLLGPGIAKDIKRQLSGPVAEKPEERQESLDL